MYSFYFMKALKYNRQANHNIPLLAVLNTDDSTTEIRTLCSGRTAALILVCLHLACVGYPVIVKAIQ